MAKLPSKDNLSGPVSLRSGRMISSADMSGIGRGLQSLGNSLAGIGAEQTQQQNAVDLARAEALKTQQFLDTQNQFDQDGDYSTFRQRAEQSTRKTVADASNLIRDPVMRERWAAQAQVDAVRTNDSIIDRGAQLRKQAETNALDEALEANRRMYVSPVTPEDVKAKARSEIIGAIEVAGEAGLLTPDQVDARKKAFVDGADVSRAELEAADNPGAFISKGFESSLVTRESGGRPGIVNPWGYAGLYQFGAPRMADLGIYNPQGENLGGWSKRKGGQGKWTGEFNIPGFPEVKKIGDFLANPAAQKAAFEIHRAKMDREIKEQGLEGYIGQTVGGVQITRDGIHAMMHLGGAGGAARALKSGGAVNAADANGTTLLAYAKMGARSNAPGYFANLSPEDQARVRKQAEAEQNRRNVETRAGIEVTVANAPTAIFNTGKYDNPLPTQEQFMTAYGAAEGAERFNNFQTAVETSRQAFDMQTMSSAAITDMVEAAKPTGSGDTAALEQSRYDTLSKAAAATIKAREADPANYARQAFPSVRQAWTSVDQPGGFQASIAASVAAQQQLGIANIKPLPNEIAKTTVDVFKDENLGEVERIGAVANVLMATEDAGQRRAIFEQMVAEGLPEVTEGAFAALERGEAGAANRLFRAAMIDPAKLPGKAPEKPADIDEAVQASLMDEGQIGDIYYGLSDGSAENLIRAQRDSKLLNNAVNLRLRNGETLDAAISGAAKDLYGDVQAVTGANAQILLPTGEDPEPVLEGLQGLMPRVREAMTQSLAVPDTVAGTARAITDAANSNYIGTVLSQGYFRNSGDGFVFIDPVVGGAVPGPDGNPMVFTLQDITSAIPQRDIRNPEAPLTDDDFSRFQERMQGQ